MGCCASVALDPKHVSQILASNLKLDASAERDLIKSYRLFKKTDANGDGRIEKSEFANAFKLEQDVFQMMMVQEFTCHPGEKNLITNGLKHCLKKRVWF